MLKNINKGDNIMNCNNQCNKLCPKYIISSSVTVVTVDGVDTLVIDIPTNYYSNRENYCIIVAQNRPTTATVDMPVAISIAGDTSIVYPLICHKTCLQATACQISGRTRIKVIVQTNATSGVFRAIYGLGACCTSVLASLPAPTTTPAPAVLSTRARTTTTKTTTTTKGVEA